MERCVMGWIARDDTLDTGHARMDTDHMELAAVLARTGARRGEQ